MKKQKTLLVTSIYAKLWGTEFGGRPSREHHYKISLLNILNMKPNKVICFTSPEEIVDLENFFYRDNQISKEFLELKIFDLKNTRYFEKIFSKKDLEVMKNFDRCFEIQYNKFFWTDELFEMFDYDKFIGLMLDYLMVVFFLNNIHMEVVTKKILDSIYLMKIS